MDNRVKEEMVEWLSKPENKELLETLKLIKESSTSGDWFEELTDSEKKSIERGRKNHQEGKTLSSDEFWKKHSL